MTPRLIALWFAGRAEAANTEDRLRRWAVWHTAALPKARRFPSLKSFGGEAPKPARKTSAQMEAFAATMAAKGFGKFTPAPAK